VATDECKFPQTRLDLHYSDATRLLGGTQEAAMAAKKTAKEIRGIYLAPVRGGKTKDVEGRIRDLWWPHFLKRLDTDGTAISKVLDELDVCMNEGQTRFQELAFEYADSRHFQRGSQKHNQRTSQFLKSNTGKMFERFIGFALAEALDRSDSPFCIFGFNKQGRSYIPEVSEDDFLVQVTQGTKIFSTRIDSDLILFDPSGERREIYMVSVKSTLKDRFHNVPFWNLLRRAAISDEIKTIRATNPDLLRRISYLAACTDLAVEQPDFAGDKGPRNLLQIDAALLDGAFVTGSRTRGVLGATSQGAVGPDRDAPFMMLSTLLPILA
jgi:hypothetical protein